MNRREVTWDAEHPTAAGHFPGNPIIPGAVLLRDIVRAIAAEHPDAACSQVVSAKFLHPVRPGETVALSWEGAADVRFRARKTPDGPDVVTGALRFDVR